MSDLDKLMQKLNTEKKAKKETPQETEELDDAEDEEDFEDDEEDQEEDQEEVEEIKPLPKKVEVKPKKETPKEDAEPIDEVHPIESEVALLQNDGVFRRELILTLKELVDVHKVNTQTLIEIKKRLLDEENADKEQ